MITNQFDILVQEIADTYKRCRSMVNLYPKWHYKRHVGVTLARSEYIAIAHQEHNIAPIIWC